MITGVVRTTLGIASHSKRRTCPLRIMAAIVAAYDVHSLFAEDVGSKLSVEVSMDFGDFQTSTPAFLVHCVAIVGLGTAVAHYALKLTQVMRAKSTRGPIPVGRSYRRS